MAGDSKHGRGRQHAFGGHGGKKPGWHAALLLGCGLALFGASCGDDESCDDFAGVWSVDWGTCPDGPPVCDIVQSSCTAKISCEGGDAVRASITDNRADWREDSGARCSLAISGDNGNGRCTLGSNSCSFSARRQRSRNVEGPAPGESKTSSGGTQPQEDPSRPGSGGDATSGAGGESSGGSAGTPEGAGGSESSGGSMPGSGAATAGSNSGAGGAEESGGGAAGLAESGGASSAGGTSGAGAASTDGGAEADAGVDCRHVTASLGLLTCGCGDESLSFDAREGELTTIRFQRGSYAVTPREPQETVFGGSCLQVFDIVAPETALEGCTLNINGDPETSSCGQILVGGADCPLTASGAGCPPRCFVICQ